MKNIKFQAKGMHCPSCEKLIKNEAMSINGVDSCEIDYKTEKGKITYDENKINQKEILSRINKLGYECSTTVEEDSADICPRKAESSIKKKAGLSFVLLGTIFLFYFLIQLSERIQIPDITKNMGYGLIFITGLLTGFHCISMCGGFVISYTAKNKTEGRKSHKSNIFYGTGKTLSYTLMGALFGLVGSAFTFTPLIRGLTGIIAGIFLLIYGLNMLNIFPILRRLRLSTPKFIEKFVGNETRKHSQPFIIGLLNGLMLACGPLQAMYIAAAGTGSALEGAKMLFFFAIGTLPALLGFGYLTEVISSKLTNKIIKLSGVVVIFLGLIMLNNGLALTGTGYDINSVITSLSGNAMINAGIASSNVQYQEIRMDVLARGWSPDKFVLKKGVPVKWIINGKEITGCNNAIQVPKLGLTFDIKSGEQTIEFTPNEEGIIPWSCWMGMIHGTFIVKEDIDLTNTAEVQKELDTVQQPKSSGCGCGSRIYK